MHYLGRDFICQRIKVSPWSSYSLFRANELHLIRSDLVISLLNSSRRGGEIELNYIPSDIITPDEAESSTGVPARKLLTWTRRSKKIPPHFRINKATTRFRLSSLKSWLEEMANG